RGIVPRVGREQLRDGHRAVRRWRYGAGMTSDRALRSAGASLLSAQTGCACRVYVVRERFAPGVHREQDRLKALAEGRKRVLHLWRHFRIDVASEHAVSFQLPKLLREGPMGDPIELLMQRTEAHGPLEQVVQHEHLPPAADHLQRGLDGTAHGLLPYARHD